MNKLFLLTLAMLFACFSMASAQAVIKPHGISPRGAEHDTTDIFEHAYNALLNVGVGTVMYFEGSDTLALSGESFSVTEQPGGSTASITETESTGDMTVIGMFVPDVEGTYVITFAHNGSDSSLTVNAGTYVGSNDLACAGCHNNESFDYKVDKWKTTGHSDMLVRGLEGTLSSHYGANCISCHTTGYDAMAENNGFDDFGFIYPDSATLVSWGSPDGHLFEGAYAKAVEAYPDAMKRANIQCEACHGPASAHTANFGNTDDSRMVSSFDVNTCAYCHDEGTHHAFPDQWLHAGEDATEFDGRGFHGGHSKGVWMARGTRAGCAPCHSGSGYVQWVKEGRPVDEFGLPTDIEVVPEPTLISCATCHDPHDATDGHQQLRLADTQLGDGTPVTVELYGSGALCMHCHRSRRNAATYASNPDNASSHFGAHHGPEADLLLAANAPEFKDANGNVIELASSPHAVAVVPGQDRGNACVNCHMAGELTDGEGNINHVGGHSWNMNDAEGNDHVEACAPCHGNVGESFKDKKYYVNGNADLDGNGTAEGLQLEVHGLMNELALLLPPYDTLEVSISKEDTPQIVKAAYVYFWIEEDRSFGMHNPAFTVSLLKAAIEELGVEVSIEYPKQGIPGRFALSQNYPNPFNPTTKIDYSLMQGGNVQITVYNVLGQQVATLVNKEMIAGNHTVDFDASNLTSGIYIYRIQVKNDQGIAFQAVNKMILMK